jgi:hypothetical protein
MINIRCADTQRQMALAKVQGKHLFITAKLRLDVGRDREEYITVMMECWRGGGISG